MQNTTLALIGAAFDWLFVMIIAATFGDEQYVHKEVMHLFTY